MRGINERYESNRRLLGPYTGYICNQCAEPAARLRYGRLGNISGMGCGPAAAYNVLKRLGESMDFPEVIRRFEELCIPRAGALLGSKPFRIGAFFNSVNIPYKKYTSAKEFIGALPGGRIAIISTWNKGMRGTHFYCVYYSKASQRYWSMNYRCDSSRPRPFALSEISPYRFIVGYVF